MDYNHFASARDFFYLAALFLGAGAGCIANRFRRKASARFRNSTVTAGFCFFSGTVAALTIAAILSNWQILKETALYLPVGIMALIVFFAFRFPRAVGFPLFLVSGVLAVVIGYASISYPVIDSTGLAQLSRDRSGVILIRPDPLRKNKVTSPAAGSARSISFQAAGNDTVLEFRAFCFYCSKVIPLMGGASRGKITEIRSNGELLYADHRRSWGIFSGPYTANDYPPESSGRLFSFWEAAAKLEAGDILPGTGLTVLLDGPALAFR